MSDSRASEALQAYAHPIPVMDWMSAMCEWWPDIDFDAVEHRSTPSFALLSGNAEALESHSMTIDKLAEWPVNTPDSSQGTPPPATKRVDGAKRPHQRPVQPEKKTRSGNRPNGFGFLCWDHGCNGHSFSSRSNLVRHQRERSGDKKLFACPRCETTFSRSTARNHHLARQCSDDPHNALYNTIKYTISEPTARKLSIGNLE